MGSGATYTVNVLPTAAKQIRRLPHQVQLRVRDGVRALATTPRPVGCKKLTGSTDVYRVRIGSYRILYQINDDRLVVLVVAVGDRRDIYGRIP